MKSIHGLTRHINTCMSQQVLPIHMQPKQNTLIPREDDNASDNFGPYKDAESILEEQDIEKDHTNLINKSSDIGNRAKDSLLGRTS